MHTDNSSHLKEAIRHTEEAVRAIDAKTIAQHVEEAKKHATAAQSEKRPEIVVLLPEHTVGWFSQKTMDVLRECVFRQLISADQEGRLRLYEPCVPGLGARSAIDVTLEDNGERLQVVATHLGLKPSLPLS